jgi:hypothetical protein
MSKEEKPSFTEETRFLNDEFDLLAILLDLANVSQIGPTGESF